MYAVVMLLKNPGRSGSRGENSVGLDPPHVERECDEDEGYDRQDDADRQEFNGGIGFAAALDQAQHAGGEA